AGCDLGRGDGHRLDLACVEPPPELRPRDALVDQALERARVEESRQPLDLAGRLRRCPAEPDQPQGKRNDVRYPEVVHAFDREAPPDLDEIGSGSRRTGGCGRVTRMDRTDARPRHDIEGDWAAEPLRKLVQEEGQDTDLVRPAGPAARHHEARAMAVPHAALTDSARLPASSRLLPGPASPR